MTADTKGIRATALAAKAAGGKLARLGAEGRATLLRDLAAALGDAAARAAELRPTPKISHAPRPRVWPAARQAARRRPRSWTA